MAGLCACVCVCACVWACVCVCVCVCVYVCMSIHSEDFIWLGLEFQETDQRCGIEDVSFLCQVPSSLPVHTLEAGRATT